MISNKRRFELPAAGDLSEEQEDIEDLELDGQHLIIGGPGTGKSVLCLSRARMLNKKSKPYCFLVFNVLLERATRQLYPDITSSRWIRWIKREFWGRYNKGLREKSNKPGDFDWSLAKQTIDEKQEEHQPMALQDGDIQYFILDEGQDMPVGFYEVLIDMGWENLFVAADENQSITGLNSTIANLREVLGLSGVHEQHDLHENFRQKDKGFFVAQLANEFYCETASNQVSLPAISRSTEIPWVYKYRAGHLDTICKKILLRCHNNPKELIGILAPNHTIRNKYLGILQSIQQSEILISTYDGNESSVESIHFDRGGVVVICAQSCKGLEFDTVFIADINEFWVRQDACTTKKLFFVMTSRARERIYLLRDGAVQRCPVEDQAILPRDDNILKRNYPI